MVSMDKITARRHQSVAIAQLGERQTEDLKVTGSIPVCDITFCSFLLVWGR